MMVVDEDLFASGCALLPFELQRFGLALHIDLMPDGFGFVGHVLLPDFLHALHAFGLGHALGLSNFLFAFADLLLTSRSFGEGFLRLGPCGSGIGLRIGYSSLLVSARSEL